MALTEAQRAYQREYKAGRRERSASERRRLAARSRAWRRRNPEKVRAAGEAWRKAHPDLVRELKQRHYQKHRAAIRAAQSTYQQRRRRAAQQPLFAAELARLRRLKNRPEALAYGSEGRAVCLECGAQVGALGSHTLRCPAKPQTAIQYKIAWGYPKGEGLLGRPARAKSAAAAKGRIEARPLRVHRKVLSSFYETRARRRAAKGTEANRIGPWASVTRERRRGEQRKPRPDAKLPAELAFGLRKWLKAQTREVGNTASRYRAAMGIGAARFSRLWPHLDAELAAMPGIIDSLRSAGPSSQRAALALSTRVWKRARRAALDAPKRKSGPQPLPLEKREMQKVAARLTAAVHRFEQLYNGLGDRAGRKAKEWLRSQGFNDSEVEAALEGRHIPTAAAKRLVSLETHLSLGTVQEYARRSGHPKPNRV